MPYVRLVFPLAAGMSAVCETAVSRRPSSTIETCTDLLTNSSICSRRLHKTHQPVRIIPTHATDFPSHDRTERLPAHSALLFHLMWLGGAAQGTLFACRAVSLTVRASSRNHDHPLSLGNMAISTSHHFGVTVSGQVGQHDIAQVNTTHVSRPTSQAAQSVVLLVPDHGTCHAMHMITRAYNIELYRCVSGRLILGM